MARKDRSSELLNFISTFFVSIIVLIALALTAAHFAGLQGFTVESNSMAPIYPVDSFVFTKETSPNEIKIGDVITYVFNEDGLLVTHRVIAIDSENETFTTKGDNNNIQDPNPVYWGNVVGKVVFGVPKLGTAMRILMAQENRPYIITTIVLIGIISLSLDLIEKKKKKSRNNQLSEKTDIDYKNSGKEETR